MPRSSFTLSVGQIVSVSIGIFLRNIIPFTLLGAVVLAPWAGFILWLPGADIPPEQAGMLGTVAFILQAVLSFALTGAVTYGVVQQLRGKPAGIGASVSYGLGAIGRIFGTAFLCGIRILIGYILLFIPGIIETVRLAVAMPVSIMEGRGAGEAVARSIELTKGSRWQIWGSWVLVNILMLLIVILVAFVLASAGSEVLDDVQNGTDPWIEIAVTVPLQSFWATMMAVTYFQLRKGKENIDVQEVASVFD